MSYKINGGVGQSDYGDIKWRLDQLVDDMNIMWAKIADLESIRDENSEPYDVMDSFRSSKPDAGEPVNQHYIDCLKQNVRLIEENDVLRYQYETMKNQTISCKEQIERLREALRELASTTYHSVDDYKERAREALGGK